MCPVLEGLSPRGNWRSAWAEAVAMNLGIKRTNDQPTLTNTVLALPDFLCSAIRKYEYHYLIRNTQLKQNNE